MRDTHKRRNAKEKCGKEMRDTYKFSRQEIRETARVGRHVEWWIGCGHHHGETPTSWWRISLRASADQPSGIRPTLGFCLGQVSGWMPFRGIGRLGKASGAPLSDAVNWIDRQPPNGVLERMSNVASGGFGSAVFGISQAEAMRIGLATRLVDAL